MYFLVPVEQIMRTNHSKENEKENRTWKKQKKYVTFTKIKIKIRKNKKKKLARRKDDRWKQNVEGEPFCTIQSSGERWSKDNLKRCLLKTDLKKNGEN